MRETGDSWTGAGLHTKVFYIRLVPGVDIRADPNDVFKRLLVFRTLGISNYTGNL